MKFPVIQMKGIHKSYVHESVQIHALDGIDLTAEQGDFVSIVGPSGSGKSTLMNVLGCLDLPDSGSYHLCGQDVKNLQDDSLSYIRNRTIGFIFQGFNLLSRTTALGNVELPLLYSGVERHERQLQAQYMLERLGLGDRLSHTPSQLSGGQQQRVAIARALINQPALLLADEPTGNLDSHTSQEIMELLEEINHDQKITIILITHDPDVAMRARHTLTLHDGRLLAS